MDINKVRRYVRLGEPEQIWDDITSWLFTNYGLPGIKDEEWYYNVNDFDDMYMDFYFKDPRVAEIFILKWM